MSIHTRTTAGLLLGFLGAGALAKLTPAPPAVQDFAYDVRKPPALSTPDRGNTVLLAFDPGPGSSGLRSDLADGMAGLLDLAAELEIEVYSVGAATGADGEVPKPFLERVPERLRLRREGPSAFSARGLEDAVDAKAVVAVGSLDDGAFVVTVLDLLREQAGEVYVVADVGDPVVDASWTLALERIVAAGAVPVASSQLAFELVENWSTRDGESVRELIEEE